MGRRQYQRPNVFKTAAKRPQWFFRVRVATITSNGIKRPLKPYYLGFCDEMGKREAERQRDAILAEYINRPDVLVQSQIRFGEVIKAFRELHIPTVRPISQVNYESNLRAHVEPAFGQMRLCDITYEAVQAWVLGIKGSYYTRRAALATFTNVWSFARKGKYTKEPCPAEFVRFGKEKAAREKRIPTVEEFIKLRQLMKEPWRTMTEVAVFTGLRISEILGISWGSLDLERGLLIVKQRLDSLENMDDPKSRKGRRPIPLGHLRQLLASIKPADAMPNDLVFSGAGCHSNCRYHLRVAAKKIGIWYVGFGFHTLRRTCNTYFRRQGASIQDARALLGHASDEVNDLYYIEGDEDFARREKIVLAMQEKVGRVN